MLEGMENLLAGRGLEPIICTEVECFRILLPITFGYKWGGDTISDLWRRCAPIPGPGVERRIISPAHLGEWLADVLERQGRPLTDQAAIYNQFANGAKHNGRRASGLRPGA